MADLAHPKGVLLERAQRLGLNRPEFRTERTGPEHEPNFLSDVVVDGEVLGTGQGGSKRTAEKNAAEEALAALDARETPPTAPQAAGKGRRSRGAKATTDPKAPSGAAAQGKGRPPQRQAAAGASGATAGHGAVNDTSEDEAPFAGPWPMFDDLLGAVVGVAEKRVSLELRGEAARVAVRDFSLRLYKELLADLGEVVDEDDDV